MDIEAMFEDGVKEGLFTDFDFCVRGPLELSFKGGRHVLSGAGLFDVASITKALTHLLLLRLFAEGILSPNDKLTRYIRVPKSGERQLWHLMSYLSKEYGFYLDYNKLRNGEPGSLKEILLTQGFGDWNQKFQYDNYASAFLGLVLEQLYGTGLEEVFHSQLCVDVESQKLLFHPKHRGLDTSLIVPTSSDESLRGVVSDLVSSAYSAENLSIAGVFSDAKTIADVFHRTLAQIICAGFYSVASKNQLAGVDDKAPPWGLGFDIPVPGRRLGPVEGPLIFSGYSGCRIFFTERPRLTICVLTNRVFCGDTAEFRERFSKFTWNIFREALQRAM